MTLVDWFWAHQKQLTEAVSCCIGVAASGCIGGWTYDHVLELEPSNCSHFKLEIQRLVPPCFNKLEVLKADGCQEKTFCGETGET